MSNLEIILGRFPDRFSKVTRITEESFASEVYLAQSATEQRILKCAHSEVKFWRELRTLRFLKDRIQVPQVIESIEPSQDFSGAMLLNRLDGHPLNILSLTSKISRECGKSLAELHSVPLEGLGYFQKDGFEIVPFHSWWAYRRDMVFGAWTKPIVNKLDAAALSRIHQKFSEYFDSLEDDSICLIHCDFRLGNIMASNEQITGLIDFESARTGDPGYDFIKIYEVTRGHEELWTSFLEGYSAVRQLPELEKLIPYYELDLNFGFLQWAVLRNNEELFKKRLSTLLLLLDKSTV